jgi:hypothetical protein
MAIEMNEAPIKEGLDLSPDERLLLGATRDRDKPFAAYTMVRIFREQGKTPAAIVQAVINTGDAELLDNTIKAINRLNAFREKPVWTYERRLALHVLGVLGLGFPGLHDDLFTNGSSPSALHDSIDEIADALIDGMHELGCPASLSLAQILDCASSFSHHSHKDGAE